MELEEEGREFMEDLPYNLGLGCALDMFREVQEVNEILNMVVEDSQDATKAEKRSARLSFILDQYQEQPHLLDKHLDQMLSKLIDTVRQKNMPMAAIHLGFRYLGFLTKVRGYKILVRHLPHEVGDLDPVLEMLESRGTGREEDENWETTYMLILWLSIIILLPFDMKKLDPRSLLLSAGDAEMQSRRPLHGRVEDVIRKGLEKQYHNCCEAAAFLSAKLFLRPDMNQSHLSQFLQWCMQIIQDDSEENKWRIGALRALAQIFKQGGRETLLPQAPIVFESIKQAQLLNSPVTLVRKIAINIVQRIGLTFLKPRVAKWRYDRGSRSLILNVEKNSRISSQSETQEKQDLMGGKDSEEDEGYEIPDEVEEIVEILLQGLRDKDTVIRWPSAKGMGRVTGRLPKELADDVLGSLLSLFSPLESENSWHGGCLALAELGRRGLLLPSRLPEVVPILQRALVFDEARGNFSVGRNIRDAACYVSWSFARAYSPQEMAPYVPVIAPQLLIVACFDREVNCRRAASAAFQENVGRQGSFPHGIDILTTADFFAVANRRHSYLDISVFIAQYEEYREALICHLVERKLNHWDIMIRSLAAEALHRLTFLAADYMVHDVIPKLKQGILSNALYLRHGALLGLGEIVHAISLHANSQGLSFHDILGEEHEQFCASFLVHLEAKGAFRQMSREMMRIASSAFICKMTLSHLPIHDNLSLLETWLEHLKENLGAVESAVQESAGNALGKLLDEYLSCPQDKKKKEMTDGICQDILSNVRSSNLGRRTGYALAAGYLPESVLRSRLSVFLETLYACSHIQHPSEETWAEARREAVKSIASIIQTMPMDPCGELEMSFNTDAVNRAFCELMVCFQDYTIEEKKRGDIGAWVREAGIRALTILAEKSLDCMASDVDQKSLHTLLLNLCQQACEKIERTRILAADSFLHILHLERLPVTVPCIQRLREVLPVSCKEEWYEGKKDTFSRFVPLLSLDHGYGRHVLMGLVVSTGDLAAGNSQTSMGALECYLSSLEGNAKALESFFSLLVGIFAEKSDEDRIAIPLMRTATSLLKSGYLEPLLNDVNVPVPGCMMDLVRCTKAGMSKRMNKTPPITKVFLGVELLVSCLSCRDPRIQRSCLGSLTIHLGSVYPRLRHTTGTALYQALLMSSSDSSWVSEENSGEVLRILEDTDWMSGDVEKLRGVRDELCCLLDVPPPIRKT